MPTPIARRLPPRVLLAAVASLALVVGLGVGVWAGRDSDLLPDRSAGRDKGTPQVAAGAIDQAQQSALTGWDFAVPVFNDSDAPVDVSLTELTGLVAPFRSEPAVRLAPSSWGNVRFSVPSNCDTAVPGLIPYVRLRVTTGGDAAVVSVPLQAEGRVLVDYLRSVCGVGEPVQPGDLAGAWIVERAYGPKRYIAGSQLMRFTRDGAFVADLDGRLLGTDSAVRGRYRLRGEVMVITTKNAFGCGAGANATWRTTLDTDGRLTMVYLGGDCPEGEQGNVWVSRRVLLDDGLPRP